VQKIPSFEPYSRTIISIDIVYNLAILFNLIYIPIDLAFDIEEDKEDSKYKFLLINNLPILIFILHSLIFINTVIIFHFIILFYY